MRRIVLTGVSRGLGRALVGQWSRQAEICIYGCARNPQAINELKAEFPHQDFAEVDVSSESSVRAWAETILEDGPPDLLINNAALINRNATLWSLPAEEFDALIDVNIKGMANVIRCLVPSMVAQRSGVIVNLSSGWGRSVSPEVAPYCASKWAVEGLTRAMAMELPNGMAAIPLNPGIIDTDMLQTCFGESSSSYPNADQWAEVAAPFLLSLDASHNGQPLTVPL